MKFCTPEAAGISSHDVLEFYKELEENHLSTHGVILSRGDRIFSECYYAPFHKDFQHRMYSVTKSFVGIAIGFCLQDGLLELDDPMGKFFSEYKDPHGSTIRHLLQMTTTLNGSVNWFQDRPADRVAHYFAPSPQKQPGTVFAYDSSGSFMLCAMVEKLTGKTLLDYLREKCLDVIGFSKEASCLVCPGGYSWGDSGLLCTARDLWLFARFILNGGSWGGKQYLSAQYVKQATTPRVTNCVSGSGSMQYPNGYGYQFWCLPKGCFAALGMGNQIAFCDPTHDFICIINSCNQGNTYGYDQIFHSLYRLIDKLGDSLPEDSQGQRELLAYAENAKLFRLSESTESPLTDRIHGREFTCQENSTGICRFRLEFAGHEGTFIYENAQGEKRLPFGMGHNVFGPFPQTGYADRVGSVFVPGTVYHAAVSADWPDPMTLRLRVQIIDKYFGNLSILFGFADENTVSIRMEKSAEDFLQEYSGLINAHR